MDACTFCKIVAGQIPCDTVYEDDYVMAFLDNSPMNKGHTLVIPKLHHRWVYDVLDPGLLWSVAHAVARALAKMDTTFVMFATYGWDVHHAHVHVIPRYEDDGFSGFPHSEKKHFSAEEMAVMAKKIASFL